VNVFVTVDDVFTVKCVVLLEWIVCSKAVDIDGERLLLADRQQESTHRFIRGFRWDHVPLTAAPIYENKYREFVFSVRSTFARGQDTRARRAVALTAFEPGFHVQLIDFNRTVEP
jgi:hypothetical protein